MIEFLMPNLGADMEDGTLVEWRKKEGDIVKRGDIIAEVDTQKGLIEIEIFDEGVIEKLLVNPGTKVPVGSLLALIKPSKEKPQITVEKEVAIHPKVEEITTSVSPNINKDIKIKISPLAKRVAFENDIDISSLMGTGENGAITKEDVDNAIVQKQKAIESQENFKTTTDEKIKSTSNSIRNAVAAAMSKSNREIPHYYLEKKINMLNALSWMNQTNKERSVKERFLPVVLLIKATALSLRNVPELNAIWDGSHQLKKQINIGFVVSLRNGGIVVPTIHQADLKSLEEIMQSLNDIIPRSRALKLRSSELSDSTITITNIGDGGIDTVYGIIYPPQVAIIGFGSISEQPYAENGLLGVRPIISVTLAGDHRATDGLTGSRFLISLNNYLQNPKLL